MTIHSGNTVRPAVPDDLPRLMELFAQAREIMRADGNLTQWAGDYPSVELVQEDIRLGRSFVVEDESGTAVGTFAFIRGIEPTYNRIYEGRWLDDTLPYATIHRLASTRDSSGVAEACFNWAWQQCDNLRVDTHADNHIMQHCILKAGFIYCGVIYLADGAPRLAFQKKEPSYLRGLRELLTPDLIQYMFPGLEDIPTTGELFSEDLIISPEFESDSSLFESATNFSSTIEERSISSFSVEASDAELEQLDPRTQEILKAWERIEKDYGITVEELEILLGYRVKLSRLSISTAGKIYLTDYGDKEVRMDDLTKALYFYFLRHPEGNRLKELQDHEEDVLKYYMGITGRDNVKEIRNSVHNMLDPYGNSLNVSISRIKKAFRDIVGDRIAKFYYIQGRAGEIRRITLDRDLVIWDH